MVVHYARLAGLRYMWLGDLNVDYMIEEKPKSLLDLAALARLANDLEERLIASGGEITPEIEAVINDLAPGSKGHLATKVDAYYYIMSRLERAHSFWKEDAAARQAVAKSCERTIEQMQLRLKIAMGKLGVTELSGNDHRYVLTTAKKRLVIDRPHDVPATYLLEVVEYVPDKERIKKDLEEGKEIDGCKLEGGTALRSYFNKKRSLDHD